MKRIYRIAAMVIAAMAALTAIGAGALIVATAIVIGALLAGAARLSSIGAAHVLNRSGPDDFVEATAGHEFPS